MSAGMNWGALAASVLRETRAARGRLVFFTLCLALGVAAVVGVSSLVLEVRGGMAAESKDLLAADLRVEARRPLPPEVAAFFDAVEHERVDLVEMGAMASVADGASRLVELKVVDEGYPFYGTLELDPPLATSALGSGAAFVGPELAGELGLFVGDELRIGGAAFEVAAVIVDEPDRVDFAMTLGPRVFLGSEGLARTNLFGEKSRVRYASLYRLAPEADADALEEELKAALAGSPYVRTRTHTNAQPSIQRSLKRVEDYLGLVALLSLLLGGIGVSQIVRAWLAGRAQSVAVLRCLGYRAREVAASYLGHVLVLALVGSLLGAALGATMPPIVRSYAPELFGDARVSLIQPAAVVRGVVLGLLVAALFSLPSLTAIWRVPPAAVLRSEAVPLDAPRAVRLGAPLALFLGVLLAARWQGGAWLPALAFSGGLLVLTALLYGGARLASRLSASVPRGRFGPYVEHGLAAFSRPGSGTTGAVVALGIGVMVVVAIGLIEGRLSTALRTALPEDAPSVFLVDVQPEQWEGVRATMDASGAESLDAVPVVMARLRELDGRDVRELAAESKDAGRASWVFTREQRLTWSDKLPEGNELIVGDLWTDPTRAEVSVEQDFAQDLGVELGSTIVVDVQGIPVELLVTSLRKVDWMSFRINFFLLVEPGVLEDAPHWRLAAARLEPPSQELALQNELAGTFPNVTVLRVRPMLDKLAALLERIALGVRFLGSFTILTGLVILAGAVGTTALRRAREAALLKALGVTRGRVRRLFAYEYALTGLVAGTLGAAGALALAWAFLEFLAELDPELPLMALPVAAIATAALATFSGLAASAKALRARPLETLRRGE